MRDQVQPSVSSLASIVPEWEAGCQVTDLSVPDGLVGLRPPSYPALCLIADSAGDSVGVGLGS